jgi:hypothetical protein
VFAVCCQCTNTSDICFHKGTEYVLCVFFTKLGQFTNETWVIRETWRSFSEGPDRQTHPSLMDSYGLDSETGYRIDEVLVKKPTPFRYSQTKHWTLNNARQLSGKTDVMLKDGWSPSRSPSLSGSI